VTEARSISGSEGLRVKYAIWPRVTGSTWDNFMLGIDAGTDSGSGSSIDMFNVVDNLLQYDGIGALFHTCDDCGIADSYATAYHDRGIVVGDPIGGVGNSQTHSFKIDHVEGGGVGFGSEQESFDIGSSAENAAISHSYHESPSNANNSAVRLGQVAGNVNGIAIEDSVFSTNNTNVPAIVAGSNFVQALRLGGNTFLNWPVGLSCSGTTSNIFLEPSYFSSVATDYSSCSGVQVQGDELQNPAGASSPVPITLASFSPPTTTLNGVAGTAICGEGLESYPKIAVCVLNGYQETGSAQTWSFPIAFSTPPVLSESGGSCGTYNPSATASQLTLPANAAMTAETCNVVAIGQ
jgi:hypothetical protein